MSFAKIHVFAYSPRAGTRAAQMPEQVPPQVKGERVERLLSVAMELRRDFLRGMVGTCQEVLFEERGKDRLQVGYTPNYTPVSVPDSRELGGKIMSVRLTGLEEDGCLGLVEEIII